MTAVDMVNHPPHYNSYSIEVIEVTRHCSFDIGNAIKYMLRHLHKGTSKQDLDKALWYLRDHLKNKGDELPLISDEQAQENLGVLISEYGNQERYFPEVAAALSFLRVDDAYMAMASLRRVFENAS